MPSTLLINRRAPGVPYFIPLQSTVAGTARSATPSTLLFTPLKIRGVEFQNRVWVGIFSCVSVAKRS